MNSYEELAQKWEAAAKRLREIAPGHELSPMATAFEACAEDLMRELRKQEETCSPRSSSDTSPDED